MKSAEQSRVEDRHPAPSAPRAQRRFPIGAEVHDQGVSFRVWAPNSETVSVLLADDPSMRSVTRHPLDRDGDGYFSGVVEQARPGQCYRLALRSGDFPDPASCFQPEGPHGPSQIVEGGAFHWTDHAWPGVEREGQVIYELHVGTFTPEGTWAGALGRLEELAELGVTLLEILPVADFPGAFGWGYDGVNHFAPTRLYGSPDDFRMFVDRAHALGLGVILDVVYNHFGPDGCYLREFSPHYFSKRYKNEWGEPLNFDGEQSQAVREFIITNAEYWIEEFHLDGLRLDATQQIFDASDDYIVAALTRAARAAAKGRKIYVVGENEPQDARLVRAPERGGHGIEALWNDDFHHSARVALTGHSEAYYMDYRGRPQEFISTAKRGFLFQGQRYRWQHKPRGSASLDLEPSQLVNCLQNHDQVANTLGGTRLHELTSPGQLRAMTALLLLHPATPMLFQGQEFAASAPFLYFADHKPELARLVSEGRKTFISQFPSTAEALKARVPHAPEALETFQRSKLDWTERKAGRHRAVYQLHRDLIQLRRQDPVIAKLRRGDVDGAVLSDEAFLLRYFSAEHGDRLLLVNLGTQLNLDPAPEPLLAPPEDADWDLRWSSEDPRYGGSGTAAINWKEESWILPGRTTLLFTAKPLHHAHEPHPKN